MQHTSINLVAQAHPLITWEGVPPASHLCNAWKSRTVHLYSELASSVDIRPVQYDPRTWICLPTHVSAGFWRRGNPMEVIDDCFVAFFGAIFGAILPITSHVLNSQKKKSRWLEKTKKLKFYLSLMSTTLFVMSWVEYCVRKVLNSTHDKKIKYSTQLMTKK